MNVKKLNVRVARMELDFAMVTGDLDEIAKAEKELGAALAETAKRRAPESREDDE
jgi:hypothetical protein